MTPHQTPPATSTTGIPDAALTAITLALSGLRYGQVTIIVQDGRILQIDRTDRKRLTGLETINSTES